MLILSQDKTRIVNFKNKEDIFLKEDYYEGKLMSYNLILEEELIESYDEEDIAVFAMQEVLRLIEEGKKYIDIKKVNLMIEA